MKQIKLLYAKDGVLKEVDPNNLSLYLNGGASYNISFKNEVFIKLTDAKNSIYVEFDKAIVRIANHPPKLFKLSERNESIKEIVDVIIKEQKIKSVIKYDLEKQESEKIND